MRLFSISCVIVIKEVMQKERRYNENTILGYIFIATLLLFSLLFLISCDTCGTENSGNGSQGELHIYFTALPLNGSVPSVYSCRPDGSDMKEIINNAIIYSAPSDDGTLAFLRKEDGLNALYTIKIDGSGLKKIESDNSQYSISYPIISSDGKKIAFYGGDSKLFVYKPDNFSIELISSNFFGESLPSFSKNSDKIAFFNKGSDEKKFSLNIVNTDNPDLIYVRLSYEGFLLQNGSISLIQWYNNSDKLAFTYSNGNGQDVYSEYLIVNENSGSTQDFVFDEEEPGVKMPDVSSDDALLCFVSFKGEVLTRNFEGEVRYSTLAESIGGMKFSYPIWNEDENYILVNRRFENTLLNNSSNYSDIVVLKVIKNGTLLFTESNSLISNNAYRGFWKKI